MAAERNRYAHGHTIRVISRAGGKTATEPIKTPSMWVGRAHTKGSILPSICRRHTANGIKGLLQTRCHRAKHSASCGASYCGQLGRIDLHIAGGETFAPEVWLLCAGISGLPAGTAQHSR